MSDKVERQIQGIGARLVRARASNLDPLAAEELERAIEELQVVRTEVAPMFAMEPTPGKCPTCGRKL